MKKLLIILLLITSCNPEDDINNCEIVTQIENVIFAEQVELSRQSAISPEELQERIRLLAEERDSKINEACN